MNLLDRYLAEIKRYLPKTAQDDIVAEIADDLQSKMDARGSELGRDLTEDEQAVIIKSFGHPKVVAARYKPAQYLIGPDLFPFYRYAIKLVLIAVLALELAGLTIAALVASHPLAVFVEGSGIVWSSILWVVGIVTLVFAISERAGAGAPVLSKLGIDKWNPRRLPATGEEVPQYRSLFEAFANTLALLWLLDVANIRHGVGLLMGPGARYLAPFVLIPAWQTFFEIVAAATAMIVVMDFVLIARPHWARLRTSVLLVANLLMVAAAGMMIPLRSYFTLHTSDQQYVHALTAVNGTMLATFVLLGAGCAIAAGCNVRTLLVRNHRSNGLPAGAGG